MYTIDVARSITTKGSDSNYENKKYFFSLAKLNAPMVSSLSLALEATHVVVLYINRKLFCSFFLWNDFRDSEMYVQLVKLIVLRLLWKIWRKSARDKIFAQIQRAAKTFLIRKVFAGRIRRRSWLWLNAHLFSLETSRMKRGWMYKGRQERATKRKERPKFRVATAHGGGL